jgi:AcrR family transcriptional regulator
VIAKRVGLSQAALFKRFGTKQGLMMAALRPPTSLPWMTLLEEGPGPGPLAEQLVSIGIMMSALLRQIVPCLSMLRASGVENSSLLDGFEGPPPPVLTIRALQAWFERAQAAGRLRPMDAEAVAFSFMGSLHGRQHMRHAMQPWFEDFDDGVYVQNLVEVFFLGIGPEKKEVS